MASVTRTAWHERRAWLMLAPLYAGPAVVLLILTAALAASVGRREPADAALTYLLVVLAASTVGSVWVGLWTAVIASLSLNYFFLPPVGTLTVADPANWFALGAFLATAVVSSQLVARARLGRRQAEERERLTRSLLRLSDALASSLAPAAALSSETLASALAKALAESMEASALVLEVRRPASARVTVGDKTRVNPEALGAGEVAPPSRPERFADIGEPEVTWVVPLGPAGGVDGLVVALVAAGGRADAMAAAEAIGRLASLAVERAWLAREAAQAEAVRQGEEFKSVLLSGVSHELRTPLAAIRLSATALQRPEVWRDPEARSELLDALDQEAARLNARVGSLLAMSRVESGSLVLDVADADAAEVVDAALRHLGPSADASRIRVALPGALPPLRADLSLIGVALANLVDNALKYGGAAAQVDVGARLAADGRSVRLEVSDRGPGLASEERDHVFERFYRTPGARKTGAPGSGLGLSIARALTEAHGGTLTWEGRPGGGSVFALRLPASAASQTDADTQGSATAPRAMA